ncbi:MAG TPA: ATP synthase subunit I [Bacillus sp. (in: firmicutes)]|uniref:ATP synthase subunit I n=1 Tax=Bacillus litorisediminis TaxID=2922713 RepID=UPI001FACEF24|nr:ATP synthase subunit I [Bacillus litorisediminis]HWO78108.1 ATP synthase subunit I [Bacillus sp. (in: firmicutes)]
MNEDLTAIFMRGLKYIFFLLSFYVLGWGFTPYQTVFAGLVLGTTLSLFNFWTLVKKTIRFGEAVAQGQKAKGLGMLVRLATAALAVTIAMRYPEFFDLISVIIGLMTFYIVIMIDLLLQSILKRNNGEER